jgi:formyl-CoA transferase
MRMSSGLFADLLVIDCGSFIAGPAAATIMSDFGARVIKIEPPETGDSYRNVFRLYGAPDELDYFWTVDNRNKESVALDLKQPAGREALEALIRKADVFITNFPFPVRERLRLRAEEVMPLNERLIYASMTSYGEAGPERDHQGFDATAWWARSGLMGALRLGDEAEPPPSQPGMGDHPTAMSMYAAIVTALYRRQATGKGGVVTTSLMANGLWSNACQVQAALCGFEVTRRPPRGQRNIFNETYRTAEGRWVILVSTDHARDWRALAIAVGRERWLEDPRFASLADLSANSWVLGPELDAIFATATWETWRARFRAAGLVFGLVAEVSDHLACPQIEANAFLTEFADRPGLRTIDSPFQVAGEAKQPPRMAPRIGQHTELVVTEFGLKRTAD